MSIITSTAGRKAAIELARADAMRPRIVGEALKRVHTDPEVEEALFEILEIQRLFASGAELTLMPEGGSGGGGMLPDLLAAQPSPPAPPREP